MRDEPRTRGGGGVSEPPRRWSVVTRIVVGAFVALIASLIAGCHGTGGTSIQIDNTCSAPLLFQLYEARFDRSVEAQLRGTRAAPGKTVDETVVHPPDDQVELVLSISSPEGQPSIEVPIVSDSIERLDFDASACAAIGTAITCSAPPVALEATVSCP